MQIYHVRLFVVKQRCCLGVLFRKNSIRQISITSVIIPVEATHTVHKTYMFDVEERIIALRKFKYLMCRRHTVASSYMHTKDYKNDIIVDGQDIIGQHKCTTHQLYLKQLY